MTTRTLLLALGLAWLAALAGVVWMMMLAGMRPHHALSAFLYMDMVLQACAVLSVASAAFGIFNGLAGARRRAVFGVAGAFGWGVLGAGLGVASARNGLFCTNDPIAFAVYAPRYADALIVLLVGLTGAILGLALLGRRSPRQG